MVLIEEEAPAILSSKAVFPDSSVPADIVALSVHGLELAIPPESKTNTCPSEAPLLIVVFEPAV